MGRLPRHWQSSGHENGSERTGRVLNVGAVADGARTAVVHHCNLCALRLRKLEFDRDTDWRDWGASTKQETGISATRSSSHAGWHHGKLDVGFDRWHVAVSHSPVISHRRKTFSILAPTSASRSLLVRRKADIIEAIMASITLRKSELRQKAQLMSSSEIDRTLVRMAHEIVERNGGIEG